LSIPSPSIEDVPKQNLFKKGKKKARKSKNVIVSNRYVLF